MGASRTDSSAPLVPGSRLLGSARALQRDQLGTYERAMRTHGDLAKFRVGPPHLGFAFDAIFDPEGARHVLSGASTGYVKDAPVYREFTRLFGEGLFTLDGEPWRARRRTLQPLFTKQRVAEYVPLMSAQAALLADSLRDGRGNTGLAAATTSYALGVLGAALFGGDMTSACPVIGRAVPVLNEHGARRGLAPVRLPAWLPSPANRRAQRAQQDMRDLVDRLVRERSGAGRPDDLLARLVAARDPETGDGMGGRAIRDEVLIFLLAGLETPASALAFALYLLGGHEEVQNGVRLEVEQVLGDRTPAAADLRALPYTATVVDEALRMYPPAHTLVRRATGVDEVLGRRIPAGGIVAVSVWGMHRNPDVWVEPEEFRPERFEESATAGRNPYTYLPFGGGPRTCIGRHIAHAQLVVAVATVVRAFRIRSPGRTPPVRAGLTIVPAESLGCEFVARR